MKAATNWKPLSKTGARWWEHTSFASGRGDTRLDPNNLDRLEVLAKEVVPMQFNTNTRLTFDVPSGGTTEANFDLSGKGRKVPLNADDPDAPL